MQAHLGIFELNLISSWDLAKPFDYFECFSFINTFHVVGLQFFSLGDFFALWLILFIFLMN